MIYVRICRYGLVDGKVKVGQLRPNKPATLYTTDSYVCAVASSTDGEGVCSSHVDGSIYCIHFRNVSAVCQFADERHVVGKFKEQNENSYASVRDRRA